MDRLSVKYEYTHLARLSLADCTNEETKFSVSRRSQGARNANWKQMHKRLSRTHGTALFTVELIYLFTTLLFFIMHVMSSASSRLFACFYKYP